MSFDSYITPGELLSNLRTFSTKLLNQIDESTTPSSPDSNSSTNNPITNSRIEGELWIDNFNNTLKCWEPLLDPLQWIIYYEKVIIILLFYFRILIFFFINIKE